VTALPLAASPTTWGVDFADAPTNPDWRVVLDEIAASGLRWLELGPIGYLPEDPEALGRKLSSLNLQVVGTFLFRPYWNPESRVEILEATRRTCRLVNAVGGDRLVLVDQPSPERVETAGNFDMARRMQGSTRTKYFELIGEVASIASDEFGVRAVVHPHAGTYIEFRDEIDEIMEALSHEVLGLCVDTGHSIYAGVDPAELVRTYRERVEHIHLKDIDEMVLAETLLEGRSFWDAIRNGIFVPIGDGALNVSDFYLALQQVGYKRPITIEQDRDVSSKSSPLTDLRRSLQFLELKVGASNEK
jgi:inosose dehydratase